METKTETKYGYEEIVWADAMIKLGLRYAVRTLDPLSGEINNGSHTIAYCCTEADATLVVRAVNSHEALLEAAKKLAKATKCPRNIPDKYCYRCQTLAAISKAEAQS